MVKRIADFFFLEWGPPALTAQDFINGRQLEQRPITEETRRAIRAGIESEALHRGDRLRVFLFRFYAGVCKGFYKFTVDGR
jgi:hypothetical protein